MLKFKVYESAELESIGTLATIGGAGSKFRFTNKSMQNTTGQLAVVVQKKDGTSATATCSKSLTAIIRKALGNGATAKQCLASIINLDIIEGENGGNYISRPKGEAIDLEDFTLAVLKAEPTASYEALVAF